MQTLLIDDIRNISADRVCRTYQDAIEALKSQYWDVVLLDHDLGCFEEIDGRRVELTGTDICRFLLAYPEYRPGRILLVTANPVGKQRMQELIDDMQRDPPVGYGNTDVDNPMFICVKCWGKRREDREDWMMVLTSEVPESMPCVVCEEQYGTGSLVQDPDASASDAAKE